MAFAVTVRAIHVTIAALVFLKVERSISATARPNVLLIVADDLGIGDVGCFGNTTLRTPNLDRLAAEGVKLTQSLAAYSVCTPSRAALLTGRHPVKTGMLPHTIPAAFIFTASAAGLPTCETTIGEIAKKAGYRTAFLGKWHQGWSVDRSDPEHHHPLNHGFDYFYGVPTSNMPDFGDDNCMLFGNVGMLKPFSYFLLFAVTTVFLCYKRYVSKWICLVLIMLVGGALGYFFFSIRNLKLLNSFMYRNYEIVEQPINLAGVTRKLVKESEDFIQARHQDGDPFLLLLSWLHVHTALATGPQFRGKSSHGMFGDTVEEMDWGIGQVMNTLHRYGMDHNTFVYFTSDHGGDDNERDCHGNVAGGCNGIFWGRKGEGATEGAIRVPGIVRWPAGITAGWAISEPVSLMDVLPTIAELLHVPLDNTSSHKLDGVSLMPLLMGQETVSPHEFFFHYCEMDVYGIRYRPRTGETTWKLMLREPSRSASPLHTRCQQVLLDTPRLYDLTSDPAAESPLNNSLHSKVIETMLEALDNHSKSLAPVPSQYAWHRIIWRPWNQPCCNFPRCACTDDKFEGMFND